MENFFQWHYSAYLNTGPHIPETIPKPERIDNKMELEWPIYSYKRAILGLVFRSYGQYLVLAIQKLDNLSSF
jgi:hypothetical protein